jgi:alpha-1,6-mannosyltransferase
MVSHESADGVLGTWGLPAGLARRAGDSLNRRTAHAYTRVVCTTAWAAAEFDRIGARNVVRAPLGVDLASWHRGHHDPAVRARHAREDQVLLVLCSRLSPEKRPGDALQALAHLRAGGVDAVLVVAGEGPLRPRLTAQAAQDRLPVTFLGHVADRAHLGALLATADVALAPGPVETFGLAALEALACGTPVVASERSALPAIIGAAGASAGTPREFADAVRGLLAVPAETRRARARARAELHPWPAAVAAFLAAHEAAVGGVPGLDDGAAGAVHSGLAPGSHGGEAEPVVHGGGAVVVHGGVASDAHGGEAASGIHGGGVVAVHGGVPSGSRDGGVEPATHGGETASGIRCAEVASDVHGGAAPSQRAVQGDGAPAGSGEAVPEVSPARGQGAQATRVPGVQVQPASLAAVTALGPEDGAP